VPNLIKEKYYQKIKFEYPTKEEAEKIMKGWQNARQENVVIRHRAVYRVWANGQSFDFHKKEDAEKVITDAKVVAKIVEVKQRLIS
jgi:predicted transposase YdaD